MTTTHDSEARPDLPRGPETEILSERLRGLIEDILEGQAPNAGRFCGNCYHPAGDDPVCQHCGISSKEVPTAEAIPLEVLAAHKRRRGREGLVVRTIAWGGLTLGVTLALLPFVFADVSVVTIVLFFGLMLVFYIGSANLANSVGDALGYRWGRSLFEKLWRDFTAARDA